jgi:hypothetical protein
MATICLRLDDVHSGTPPHLLALLDQRVWRGRPVVLGVIPFPAPGCLGNIATRRETHGVTRRSLASPELRTYLHRRIGLGMAEVAVHGLTHADHVTTHGPGTPELVLPSQLRVDMLLDNLHALRREFGTSTLIPPHNFIDEAVAARSTAEGFHLSRALMNHEVAAFGLDPKSSDSRAEAKRRRPYYPIGPTLVIYQTAAISARDMPHTTPLKLAESIVGIIGPAGYGAITFHWWDFLHDSRQVNETFISFASQFLDACQQLGVSDITTIANLGDLCRKRSPSSTGVRNAPHHAAVDHGFS